MNPLTNMKNQQKMNERELSLGLTGTSSSWHREYDDSAWVYVGGLPYDLTEGDIICILSQYGEIVNVNLVRDKDSGKSKGFAFVCYEDQRSTILAVDNLNGAKVLGRALRFDHKHDYQVPKEHGDEDELTKQLREYGCAPSLTAQLASDEKEIQKKKKEKKKKKKKDRSQSRSPSREVVKSSERNRDASPLVRVKSEFPEDIANFERKSVEKHFGSHENDVGVKKETDRRKVNSSDISYQRGRPRSPPRRDDDIDVGRDGRRFHAVDDGRSSHYSENSLRREPHREDRSHTVKTDGKRLEHRHDDKSSSKNRETLGHSGQRDGQKKRRRRSTSASEGEDDRTVISPSRSQRHRSADGSNDRRKRQRRNSSSSDDDRCQTQNDRRTRVVYRERHNHQSRSHDGKDRSDPDNGDRERHKHRLQNAR